MDGEFDFIICSDLLNDLWDVQSVFEKISPHCHPRTRILINCYSRLWERSSASGGDTRAGETTAEPKLADGRGYIESANPVRV